MLKTKKKQHIKIFIPIVSVFFLFFGFTSPAYSALSSDPVSKFPLNQRDKFNTDLFTGTANYTYPLKVPQGTNGLTPEVSFSYNSAGVRDLKTYLGMGWQLNLDYVERDINYTVNNTSDDKFKLHFKGGVYDLVYNSSTSRYHTKVESNLHIQKLTGGSNTYSDYWQVISPNGTKYRFGHASQSELVCNERTYVASWNVDRVTDTNDNKIYYDYTENDGIIYLSQIKYNNDETRIINFDYTTNPYEHRVYNQGCSSYDLKRLSNIQIKIGSNLVREYDMTFGQADNTQPTLDSITESGSDRADLPPTNFTYKPEIQTWNTTPSSWINNASLDGLTLDRDDVTLADMNGDGLIDIVKTDHHGGPNVSWKVLLNQGNGWSTSFQYWANNVAMESAHLDRSGKDVRLMDVNGDNLPDVIMAENAAQWRVWKNNGTTFNTTYETWADLSSVHSSIKLSDPKVLLTDVTGDGLPDIIRSWTNGQMQWETFVNTGTGWSTTPEVWSFNNIPVGLDDAGVRVMDVNGDGLADVIRTIYNSSNGLSSWYVWKSTGTAWTSQTMWLDDYLHAYFQRDDVTLTDVNGDGLPDIVKSFDNGLADEWKVIYNRGGSWTATWQTWIPTSANIDIDVHNSNTKIADTDGDGLADILKGYGSGGSGEVTWSVWKNNGISPHLLSSIHTSQGGDISFNYTKAVSFDNTGSDSIPDLPFPLWVVQSMTVNNGMNNAHETEDVTTYSYQDGFYKWQDREFRGFGIINAVEPNGSKKQYTFSQEDSRKGRLTELIHRDSSNNPYHEIENSWSNSSSDGIYTVNLTQEKNYIYDGSGSSPKVTQTDYTYDSYGNITKTSQQADTGNSGDERFTYYEYVYNTTDWIINTIKKNYLNDSDDSTKISETTFYYDGNSNITDTPSDGNLTKEIHWTDGWFTIDPTTTYSYDSYGNQLTVTDPNGHTTTTAYETTGTYPTSVINAKSQQTHYFYDLGTGNLLSQTDPNGIVNSFSYDVFGRKKVESRRAGVNDLPQLNYTYFTDGTAPEGVLVTKRNAGATATNGDLKIYTFMDGLERKIQTRSDAEDVSKQIIVDTFYNSSGNIAKETVPYLASSSTTYGAPDNTVKFSQTTYDILSRPITITNTKLEDKTISYDHWKETIVDENGHTKREFKNAYGKIWKVEEVNDASTYTTTYNYDARDLLTKIIDHASNEIIFSYDTLGRKISQVDPDMGEWTYDYDPVGNLITQIDAKNVTITREYDELDRITKIDYPTDIDVEYTYDVDTLGKSSRIGTLSSVVDQAGTISYTYNDYLLKTSEKRLSDGESLETGYSYDYADRLVQRKNPDGKRVVYTYNAQGELETLKEHTYNRQGDVESIKDILDDVEYNSLGKITANEFSNGVTTNYSYNTDDFRLNRIQTGGAQDLSYTYDNIGNVLTIEDNINSKTQTFTYDDLDRLKTASETEGYSHEFEYDPIGNITEFTSSEGSIEYSYGEDAGPHAMTSSTEAEPSTIPNSTATPMPSLEPVQNHNLLSNGSFEELDSGWATHWIKVSNFISVDTSSNGNDEENSAKFVPNSSSAFLFSENINIDPSKSYDWKHYLKADAGTGEFGYYIDEYDDEGNWISGQWKGLQAYSYTGYKTIEYTPSSNDVASVGLQYYAVPNSMFTVYIDSVSFSVRTTNPNINPRQAMVSFTFDDGIKNTYTNAAPILEKHGIKGTVYVPPDCIDDLNDCRDNVDPEEEFMTWDEVVSLQDNYGWEIGSHTSSHENLSTLTGTPLLNQILDPLATFTLHGITTTNFASPQGDYDSESLALVAKYYKSHRGFHNKGFNAWPGDPMTINVLPVQNGSLSATPVAGVTVDQVKNAIDTAINNNTWLVLVFHGIKTAPSNDVEDYEFSVDDLNTLAQYTKQKQTTGDIMPVTVDQALDINETNILDGDFTSGVPTGWTTTGTVTSDSSSNGSMPSAVESLELTATGSANFVFTNAISSAPNTLYGFKAYANNSNLTAGELGYYVDEYDSVGNWISGKWLGAVQPTYVAYFSRIYKPTSPQVATFKFQTYMTSTSAGSSYIDNYELYNFDQ